MKIMSFRQSIQSFGLHSIRDTASADLALESNLI